ncbi:MAG: hypothetical protein Fur0037_17510 [Planctomycetota bacterium]
MDAIGDRGKTVPGEFQRAPLRPDTSGTAPKGGSVFEKLFASSSILAFAAAAFAQDPAGTQVPQPPTAPAETHISFGVYSYKKATDVYKSFEPVITTLQSSLVERLGRPVVIDLRIEKTYEECLDRFVEGKIDFVRFGPASYVLAKERNKRVELLAAEQEGGKKECQGVIAVRVDSPIRTLADLKGRSFAFGDDQSTIGRYLSQALLVESGIRARDLKSYQYLGRHDIVFKAVEIGDFDAGAMHINVFTALNGKEPKLRILGAPFPNAGKPWIARAGLDPVLRTALADSLLAIRDENVLASLKVDGFLKASDRDYDPVRKGMKLAKEFERTEATPAPGKQ